MAISNLFSLVKQVLGSDTIDQQELLERARDEIAKFSEARKDPSFSPTKDQIKSYQVSTLVVIEAGATPEAIEAMSDIINYTLEATAFSTSPATPLVQKDNKYDVIVNHPVTPSN